MKKELKKYNKTFIYAVPLVVFFLAIGFYFFSGDKTTTTDTLSDKISPLELSSNKELYEGKTITILDAYVPSELYIYIKSDTTQEKIFIDPPNRTYCRYFNLTGTLQEDTKLNRWVFKVETAQCIKEGY